MALYSSSSKWHGLVVDKKKYEKSSYDADSSTVVSPSSGKYSDSKYIFHKNL